MQLKKVVTVYKKEIKDTLRDRRTLMMMVLVPILLYPVLFAVVGQIMAVGTQQLEKEKSVIAYIPEMPIGLDSLLVANSELEVLVSPYPAEDLQNRAIQAYLEQKSSETGDSLLIYFDAAVDRSRLAKDRLNALVEDYQRQLQVARLQEAGVALDLLEPLKIRAINMAPPAKMGGMLFGSIIPTLLIVTLVLGAMYPAIDLTAGEKERGTLETILTVPVQRLELLLGKYLTVTTIALITGILNLLSMSLAYSLGFIQLGIMSGKLEFAFSPPVFLLLLLLIIPLALFLSAAVLSVAIFARSFKDAQNLVTPLYILLMFPALIATAPGIELKGILVFIPILNVSLLFKEILLHNYSPELIFSVLVSNLIFAGLTIIIFSKLFNAEAVLFAEGKSWQFSFHRSQISATDVLQPGSALLIFTLIMILLFYAGSLLQLKFREWGIFATEWLLLFLPIVVVLWYNKVNFKKTLHLSRFHPLALVGTLFLTAGSLVLTAWVAQLQARLFPDAAKIAESLEELLNIKKSGLNILLSLAIFAVTPAICEEILFRGVLLASFRKWLSPGYAIGFVALLFGLFHLHIFRLLPTVLIGLYLTVIVYFTGSIFLSMIAHALNNGFVLLLISYPAFQAYFPWLMVQHSFPPLLLAGIVGCIVTGIFLMLFARRLKHFKS